MSGYIGDRQHPFSTCGSRLSNVPPDIGRRIARSDTGAIRGDIAPADTGPVTVEHGIGVDVSYQLAAAAKCCPWTGEGTGGPGTGRRGGTRCRQERCEEHWWLWDPARRLAF
jgi:hypothetical protein